MKIDHTHNPDARSWVTGADEHSTFPVQNLPLGMFSLDGADGRIGCAIGDFVIDMAALAREGLLPEASIAALQASTLNLLFAQPEATRTALRHAIFALLTSQTWQRVVARHLIPAAECEMRLPFAIGDYTDFYVGIHHAANVGKLFRPTNPLLPNYKYVPIGYHGRASSVRVSGTPLVRPKGQIKAADAVEPSVGPTARLDYELELGIWIAGENELGQPVAIADAWDRIGGICVLNDWSARDLQAWEYQPLGPFLAKNFLTSVSPWVVTSQALAPFRIAQPARPGGDPKPLPYLLDEEDQKAGALSLDLEVSLSSVAMREAGLPPQALSRGHSSSMYWTVAQMVAHHTVNGCDLQPGDLLGTGTISGATRDSFGSLLELSNGGSEPLTLANGETRTFLEDGDELTITVTGTCEGFRSIGLGSCSGVVRPALA